MITLAIVVLLFIALAAASHFFGVDSRDEAYRLTARPATAVRHRD
jgi:hypothetical protein